MGNKDKKNNSSEKNTNTETKEKKTRSPFADKSLEKVEGKYEIILTRIEQTVFGEKVMVKAYRIVVPQHPDKLVIRLRKGYAYLTSLGLISTKAGAVKTADPKVALLRATVLFNAKAVELAKGFEECPVDFEKIAKWISRMEKATDVTAASILESAEKARDANKASRDKKIAAKKEAAKKDVE
jgi:hypothetical protein